MKSRWVWRDRVSLGAAVALMEKSLSPPGLRSLAQPETFTPQVSESNGRRETLCEREMICMTFSGKIMTVPGSLLPFLRAS